VYVKCTSFEKWKWKAYIFFKNESVWGLEKEVYVFKGVGEWVLWVIIRKWSLFGLKVEIYIKSILCVVWKVNFVGLKKKVKSGMMCLKVSCLKSKIVEFVCIWAWLYVLEDVHFEK